MNPIGAIPRSSSFTCRSRALLAACMVLGAGLSWGAEKATAVPSVVTSMQSLQTIDNLHASLGIPVALEATVIYSRGYQRLLFVQDHNFAIFVDPPSTAAYAPGERIRILGTTAPSFKPNLVAKSIRVISPGKAPDPVQVRFNQLLEPSLDARLVRVRGKVRAADLVSSRTSPPVESAILQVTTEGGHLEAYVDSHDLKAMRALLDAEVEMTGVNAGKFDDKMQKTGVVLYVSRLADIQLIHSAATKPWSIPPVAMDQILSTYDVNDLSKRVRVVGTVTYFQPGSAVVLQSGKKSLWISTYTHEPIRVGDIASATGFPNARNRALSLVDGEIQDSGVFDPIPPHIAKWNQLALWDESKPVGHQYDLITTEGTVLAEVRQGLEDRYLLSSEGHLFTAVYRHSRGGEQLPPMRQVPVSSKIRVTGICMIEDGNIIHTGQEVPFTLLIRSYDDIAVVEGPPFVNTRNLLYIVAILITLLFLGGLMAWRKERLEVHRTAISAWIERKRGQILEDINGTRPLVEILEDITQLVSSKLSSFPCWCDLADGRRFGIHPHTLDSFRVAQQDITDRAGSVLGTISVALSENRMPKQETEALKTAAALAALAMETRRLFSDLVHRSEFDELTEIQNRFSFEKHIEENVLRAQLQGGVFGIIFVDLNDFKRVNDNYGHLVGDMFLKQVATRMKHQLRDRDVLARLGGDEFAVLLPSVHNREEVNEISKRLARVFDESFALDSYVVAGSASFGCALYPRDGTTKDELLSVADASMYIDKQTHKESLRATRLVLS